MNRTAGFTLIEVIVTIAIMAILASISVMSFKQMQVRAQVEKQVHDIYTDLQEARTNALLTKVPYAVIFQPSSYVVKSYNDESEIATGALTLANGVVVVNKTLNYSLTLGASGDISGFQAIFNSQGLGVSNGSTFTNSTIVVNPLSVDAAVDCLTTFVTRINVGKMNGGNCEFK